MSAESIDADIQKLEAHNSELRSVIANTPVSRNFDPNVMKALITSNLAAIDSLRTKKALLSVSIDPELKPILDNYVRYAVTAWRSNQSGPRCYSTIIGGTDYTVLDCADYAKRRNDAIQALDNWNATHEIKVNVQQGKIFYTAYNNETNQQYNAETPPPAAFFAERPTFIPTAPAAESTVIVQTSTSTFNITPVVNVPQSKLSAEAQRILAAYKNYKAKEFESNNQVAKDAAKAAEAARAELTIQKILHPAEATRLQKEYEKAVQQANLDAFNRRVAEQAAMMQEIAKRKAELDAAQQAELDAAQRAFDDAQAAARRSLDVNAEENKILAKTILERMTEDRIEQRLQFENFLRNAFETAAHVRTDEERANRLVAETIFSGNNPTPEDIARNARNTVEAAKILIRVGGIGIDTEAASVEQVQKEIAGK